MAGKYRKPDAARTPANPKLAVARIRRLRLKLSIPNGDIDEAGGKRSESSRAGPVMSDVLADTHSIVWFLFDPA